MPEHRYQWLARSAALLTAFVPAFVLALAGIAKLNDPFLAGVFLRNVLHLRLHYAIWAARGLGAVEILVAVAMVALMMRSILPVLVGIALYASFAGLLLRLLLTERNAATCGCFGDLFSGPGQQHFWGQFTLDIVLATMLVARVLLARRLHARPAFENGEATARASQTQG
jgi:hypothetical protein